MKKITKILCKVMPIVLVGLLVVSNVFGIGAPIDSTNIGGTANDSVKKIAGNIWQTVASVLQILAIAAVVFAGIRYMFASADTKADIKKEMVVLVLGAVLVFGASTVLKLVNTAANDIMATN